MTGKELAVQLKALADQLHALNSAEWLDDVQYAIVLSEATVRSAAMLVDQKLGKHGRD